MRKLIEIEKITDEKRQMLYVIASIISRVVFKEEIYTDFTPDELIDNIISNLKNNRFFFIKLENFQNFIFSSLNYLCLNWCRLSEFRFAYNFHERFIKIKMSKATNWFRWIKTRYFYTQCFS